MQPPIILPAGQIALAELQKEVLADRIDAGNVGVAIGDVHVVAAMLGDVVERRPERARGFVRRHAECEWQGVGGIGIAQRQPADACNDNKLSHASLLILPEHDLFRKPASTFRDRALAEDEGESRASSMLSWSP